MPLLDSVRLDGFAHWRIDVGSSSIFAGAVLVRTLAVALLAAAAWVTMQLTRARRSKPA